MSPALRDSRFWIALRMLLTLACVVVPAGVGAQVVDCEHPRSAVERLVCASPALVEVDARIDSLYQATLPMADPSPAAEVQAQHAWRRQRDACKALRNEPQLRACVESAYDMRLSDLARRVEFLGVRETRLAAAAVPAVGEPAVFEVWGKTQAEAPPVPAPPTVSGIAASSGSAMARGEVGARRPEGARGAARGASGAGPANRRHSRERRPRATHPRGEGVGTGIRAARAPDTGIRRTVSRFVTAVDGGAGRGTVHLRRARGGPLPRPRPRGLRASSRPAGHGADPSGRDRGHDAVAPGSGANRLPCRGGRRLGLAARDGCAQEESPSRGRHAGGHRGCPYRRGARDAGARAGDVVEPGDAPRPTGRRRRPRWHRRNNSRSRSLGPGLASSTRTSCAATRRTCPHPSRRLTPTQGRRHERHHGRSHALRGARCRDGRRRRRHQACVEAPGEARAFRQQS